MHLRSLLWLFAAQLALPLTPRASGQTTAFTYQGFLSDSGVPANGTYDLTFTLFNASSGGSVVGSTNAVNDLAITNGLFTVSLDFGSAPLDGSDRWLEVGVRPGASTGPYTNLTPRQPLTAAPYAIRAANFSGLVGSGQLSGSYGNPLTMTNAANVFVGTFTGNGTALSLPGNVARLGSNQTFTGVNVFTNVLNSFVGTFSGNGAGLSLHTNVAVLTNNQVFSGTNAFTNTLNLFVGTFRGNGTGLSLPTNVAVLTNNQTFSGTNAFTNTLNSFAGTFVGNGTGLSLSTNVALLTNNQTFSGTNAFTNVLNSFAGAFTGNGAGLTSLNASTLSTGTVPPARLSTNVAVLNSNQTFSGMNTFGTGKAAADSQTVQLRVEGAGTSTWQGAGAFGHNGAAVVLGEVNGVATLGGQTAVLDAWTNLALNSGGGNVGIGTNGPTEKLHVNGNILATGTITPNSDRNAKTAIVPADTAAILDKVAALPIEQWRFKAEPEGVKHVGPMAQDFHAAFGLGTRPTGIATVDADGVALAAIQALNQRLADELKRRDAENAELKQTVEELRRLVQALINRDSDKRPVESPGKQ